MHHKAPPDGNWKYRLLIAATLKAQRQRTSIRRIIVWIRSGQSVPCARRIGTLPLTRRPNHRARWTRASSHTGSSDS